MQLLENEHKMSEKEKESTSAELENANERL